MEYGLPLHIFPFLFTVTSGALFVQGSENSGLGLEKVCISPLVLSDTSFSEVDFWCEISPRFSNPKITKIG